MEITLGQCLLLYRNKRGLTHKELGSRVFPELSAPHQKIKKIESGIYEPKPEELRALARELDISVSELKNASIAPMTDGRLYLDEELFEVLPSLRRDLEIINHAAHMDREEFTLTITQAVLKNCLADVEEKLKPYAEATSTEADTGETQVANSR